MNARNPGAADWQRQRNTHSTHATESGTMERITFTNAASMPAAGEPRLRAGLGQSAYTWAVTASRAGTCWNPSVAVIVDTKHRFRWPGDPSS